MNALAMKKFATEKDIGEDNEKSLVAMLRSPSTKREQYIKAGVKYEDRNIANMKKKQHRILGINLPKYPIRNTLNSLRRGMETENYRRERFGKAYDKNHVKRR